MQTHTPRRAKPRRGAQRDRTAAMRVLLLPLLLELVSAPAPLRAAPDLQEAAVYLRRYGYLPSSAAPQGLQTEQMIEALRLFQKATGLLVSGRVDGRTLGMMRAPRCGLRDALGPALEYRVLGRWRKTSLTYRVQNHPRGLGLTGTRAALRAAFGYWSAAAPLHFSEARGGARADISVSFHSRDRGCPVAFDGPGQVLGHADAPESGVVHFDADELWTEGRSYGTNLRIVAAHEIGHALGLGHSQDPHALMGPVYRGYRPRFTLHADDIRGIQSLYGKPVEKRAEEEPTRDPCHEPLDAIMQGPGQQTFAFRGHRVWTLSSSGFESPVSIGARWKELPSNINAAAHSHRTNKSYFFKGDKLWRYTGFKLDQGYPKTLGVPSGIQAAFFLRSRRALVLVKGSDCWLWDELAWGRVLLSRRPLSQLSASFPSDPDAAVASPDGRVFVFRGERVWSVSGDAALSVEKGHPLRIREMSCDD